MDNKSQNILQPKRAEDLIYVYTNSRLLAEEKEKDKKKWNANNMESEDSYFALKEEVKDHGDLDLDGWNDGNYRFRGSYEGTKRSPYAPRKDRIRDPND